MADSKELATKNYIKLFSLDEAKKTLEERRASKGKVNVIISRTFHIRKPDQVAIEKALPLAMSVGITRAGSIIAEGLQTERHGYGGTMDVIEEASIGEVDPSAKMGGVRFYPGGGIVSFEEVDPSELKQYLLGARKQNRLESDGEFIAVGNSVATLQTKTLTTLQEIEGVVPLEETRVIEIHAFIPEEEPAQLPQTSSSVPAQTPQAPVPFPTQSGQLPNSPQTADEPFDLNKWIANAPVDIKKAA